MGRLIDREKRQRAQKRRLQRKQRILEKARSTFARAPYVEVTLDQIGQRAGVDRGVASMYFGSKEGLFLIILKEELSGWYEALEAELASCEPPLGHRQLASLLAHSISGSGLLARFLSLAPVVLEQNLEVMEIFHFQRWRHQRMTGVGDHIARVTGLSPADGFHVLHLAQLMTAGLEPAANPRGAVAFDHADPEFANLAISLEEELSSILSAVMASRSEQ
jgi:AcrR family transcriptional regulator